MVLGPAIRPLVLTAVLSAGWATCAATATAAPICEGETYPQAGNAIATWEASANVRMTASARERVESDLCHSAKSLKSELGLQTTDIDRNSPGPIADYLNAALAPQATTKSLDALILRSMGLGSGPANPEPRALGVLNVDYSRQLDTLRLADRSYPPYPRFLAELGSFVLEGRVGSQVVCRLTVTIRAFPETRVRC